MGCFLLAIEDYQRNLVGSSSQHYFKTSCLKIKTQDHGSFKFINTYTFQKTFHIGWGDGSVSKMFAMQAVRLEVWILSKHLKNLDVVV